MGCADGKSGAKKLTEVFEMLELDVPEADDLQYVELKSSVNPVRLKNHPIALNSNLLEDLYHKILR